MYRTVIVDNESEQAELLYQRVSGSPYAGELDIVRIEDITALLQGDLDPVREADILLCDICLQDGSGAPTGIDLVEQLAPDNGMQIVYVTGYDGYHTSVYRTDHTYFLTKPIQQADMDNALKRCLDRLRQHAEQPLRLKSGGTKRVIQPAEIVFVESARRIVHVHTESEVFDAYAKISDLEHALPDHFVRCHKGYLANLAYVTEYTSGHLTLVTGDVLPISQSRRPQTREAFMRFVRAPK